MHEWGIVQEAIDEIVNLANKNNIKKVEKVYLTLGEDDHLTSDSVRFCFDCLSRGTSLEGVELEIRDGKERGVTIESIEGE